MALAALVSPSAGPGPRKASSLSDRPFSCSISCGHSTRESHAQLRTRQSPAAPATGGKGEGRPVVLGAPSARGAFLSQLQGWRGADLESSGPSPPLRRGPTGQCLSALPWLRGYRLWIKKVWGKDRPLGSAPGAPQPLPPCETPRSLRSFFLLVLYDWGPGILVSGQRGKSGQEGRARLQASTPASGPRLHLSGASAQPPRLPHFCRWSLGGEFCTKGSEPGPHHQFQQNKHGLHTQRQHPPQLPVTPSNPHPGQVFRDPTSCITLSPTSLWPPREKDPDFSRPFLLRTRPACPLGPIPIAQTSFSVQLSFLPRV